MKKVIRGLAIAILIVGISIGYSYLNTSLAINGTTTIESNEWLVKFSSITSENVTGKASITTAAAISTTTSEDDTITFDVNLSKPGDTYELKAVRANAGTIDAILDSIEVTGLEGTGDYLTMYITDPDSTSTATLVGSYTNVYSNLMTSTELDAETNKNIIVKLVYETDIDADDLLTTASDKEVSIKMNYVQNLN